MTFHRWWHTKNKTKKKQREGLKVCSKVSANSSISSGLREPNLAFNTQNDKNLLVIGSEWPKEMTNNLRSSQLLNSFQTPINFNGYLEQQIQFLHFLAPQRSIFVPFRQIPSLLKISRVFFCFTWSKIVTFICNLGILKSEQIKSVSFFTHFIVVL